MHNPDHKAHVDKSHSEGRFILGEVNVTIGSDVMKPQTSPGWDEEASPELQPGLSFNEMIFMRGEGCILPMHIFMLFFMKI